MESTARTHNRRVISAFRGAQSQRLGDNLVVVKSLDGFAHPEVGMPSFTLKGKGLAANTIAVNVFKLLEKAGIPTCFVGPGKAKNSYLAHLCRPIPLRFVVRRSAQGSFVKRYPHQMGEKFNPPFVEIFLKDVDLGNPIVIMAKDFLNLHYSHVPLHPGTPFEMRELSNHGIENLPIGERSREIIETLKELSLKGLSVIEAKFAEFGVVVLDVHFEFGINPWGKIVLMDPIDNKAWRILGHDGHRLDGEAYQHIKVPTEEDYGLIKRNYGEVVRITNIWHQK